MPAVSMGEILTDAQRRGYAVGGFDTWNLESIRAVVEAAEELRSPAVILTGPYGLGTDFSGLEYYAAMAKVAAKSVRVPIAILLNEVPTLDLIVKGIECGFTGVMMDATHLPLEENIKQTGKVVEIAHASGITVESQPNVIPLKEDKKSSKEGNYPEFDTDPETAARFVNETNIDAISVVVGNIHTLHDRKVELDLERLRLIKEKVDIPLVLHGGTGISDNSVREAISLGVCKFNLGLGLREAFLNGIRDTMQKDRFKDSIEEYTFVEKVMDAGKEKMKKLVCDRMNLWNSVGKA